MLFFNIMEQPKRKKILIPILNRAHYGRLRSVLKAVNDHPKLELMILVASPLAYSSFFLNLKHSRPALKGQALRWYLKARFLSWAGKLNPRFLINKDFLIKSILDDGFPIYSRVPFFIDGGSSVSMAKSVGFGLIKLADEFNRLKPDAVFVNADRFEMMAVALAAAYLNIPIAHNEAGDVSGTIDESVRHAITKLAQIHFTSTQASRDRVIQMGENPQTVFAVGSPAIDVVKNLDLDALPKILPPGFQIKDPYLLVVFHPVATESSQKNIALTENILKAVENMAMPAIFLGSNIDGGSKEVGLMVKKFLSKNLPFVHFYKTLPPDDFYRFLAGASCALGNSSSFIREGAFFGAPAVIVGSRQQKRERGENIKEAGCKAQEIERAVKDQIAHGRFASSLIFGSGKAGEQIAQILAETNPPIQKTFFDRS